MADKPPSDGARKPGEDRDDDRDTSHPADKPTKPQTDSTSNREHEHEERLRRREEELDERRHRREHVENPAFFVAEPQDSDAPPNELDSRIFPFSGSLYVAVRRRYADEPLRDPEARIGVCDVHPLPATVPAEKNPCPYQLSCYTVATSAVELRQAICDEILVGSPDMSRRQLLKSVQKRWRIVKLEADAVRCGWLFDDPALAGGEPQLRHDGQLLASRDASSWRRVRAMLDNDVAMIVLAGDPEGTGAQRMLIFTVPGLALTKVKALRWGEPTAFSELEGWRGLGRGVRPASAQLPNRQSLWRRVRSELKFRFRMWRGNRRAAKSERRERRDQRRREAAERWAVRSEIAAGLRDWLALIREGAETAIVLAKAALILIAIFAGPLAIVLVAVRLLQDGL